MGSQVGEADIWLTEEVKNKKKKLKDKKGQSFGLIEQGKIWHERNNNKIRRFRKRCKNRVVKLGGSVLSISVNKSRRGSVDTRERMPKWPCITNKYQQDTIKEKVVHQDQEFWYG